MLTIIKHALSCFMFIFFSFISFSQELSIGETCPDLPIRNIINSEMDDLSLSRLKGKLVIFDFWSTNCIPCIRNFPKLDSLQEKFRNELKIIAVTREPKKEVVKFLEKRGERHSIDIATDDTLLKKYFPYRVVPHYVWIDKEGKLLATTPEESITVENISSLLKNEVVSFVSKKDLMDFDVDKPLESSEILYRSIITPYKPGLNQAGKTFYHSKVENRIQAFNLSIGMLYDLAFDQHHFGTGRLILKTKDSAKLVPPKNFISEEWRRNNTYCFDLIVDSNKAKYINDIMVNNLNDYFGLIGTLEEIDTTCLVLLRTSANTRYKSKGEKPEIYWTDEPDNHRLKYLRNRSLVFLIRIMFNMKKIIYVIDETGIKENVTIEFTAPLDDIEGLNRDLKKYDLQFVYARRKIPFVVIKDKR